MMTVTLLEEEIDGNRPSYRAISGRHQASGMTPGQAIDALASHVSEVVDAATIIVRRLSPDRFFNAEQRHRLEELMGRWRAARDSGSELNPTEQLELEGLIEAEVRGSTERAIEVERDLTS